jgi:dienelactone hydrolase
VRRLALVVLAACGSSPDPDTSVEELGDYRVGTASFKVSSGGPRNYTMQSWYPTDVAPSPVAIETLEEDPERTTYAGLLDTAPDCATRTLDVAVNAAPLAGSFPFVILSHCHSCTRLSNATTAIRLASHGFVALSIDHDGDTLWDQLEGNAGSLDADGLQMRVDAVNLALDADDPSLVSADRTRIGIAGHSFGGVTAGRVAQLDERIQAAASLAAPMENPLIPGVTLSAIDKPLFFLVAREDNSITEFGNNFIRDNFAEAPAAAWKLEVDDAGHWSVSDLAGLTTMFAPGCGDGIRQTNDEAFTYLDPVRGRDVTAAYVTAFFRATLENDEGARAYIEHATETGLTVDHHD